MHKYPAVEKEKGEFGEADRERLQHKDNVHKLQIVSSVCGIEDRGNNHIHLFQQDKIRSSCRDPVLHVRSIVVLTKNIDVGA